MTDQKTKSDDYIGLGTIKTFLLGALGSFFRILAFCRQVFKKHRVVIIIAIIVGAGIGALIYSARPKYFQASMIVEFNELTKKSYADIFEQLNTLAKTETNDQLATELKIAPAIAEKITSISSENISGEPLAKDTSTLTRQPFKIIIGMKERQYSDTLQNAIISYINQLPYLAYTKKERIKIFETKLAFINLQLQKIDSLNTEYTRFLSNAKISATFYNNAFNPAEIYRESLTLAEEKEQISEWLALESSPLRLIDGFKLTKVPKSTSLIASVILYALITFAITFIITFLGELNSKIRNRYS